MSELAITHLSEAATAWTPSWARGSAEASPVGETYADQDHVVSLFSPTTLEPEAVELASVTPLFDSPASAGPKKAWTRSDDDILPARRSRLRRLVSR